MGSLTNVAASSIHAQGEGREEKGLSRPPQPGPWLVTVLSSALSSFDLHQGRVGRTLG